MSVGRVKSLEELEREICFLRREIATIEGLLMRDVRPVVEDFLRRKSLEVDVGYV